MLMGRENRNIHIVKTSDFNNLERVKSFVINKERGGKEISYHLFTNVIKRYTVQTVINLNFLFIYTSV